MQLRTGAAVVVVLVALAGAAYLGVTAGFGTGLSVTWASDTGDRVPVNHHEVASTPGSNLVFAPVSGESNTTDCALHALDAASGATHWKHDIAPAACTVHGVASPVVTDYDADGSPEVFVATNENQVLGLAAADGAVEFRQNLSNYGYTKPLVANVTGGDGQEIVVVTVAGTVTAFEADGTRAWVVDLGSTVFGQPATIDVDGDETRELVVGLGSGTVVFLEKNGTISGNVSAGTSVTWMTTGQLDSDDATEVVVASSAGTVTQLDASGRSWQRDFGEFAAVHAVADGDRDGTREVYVAVKDGTLHSVDGRTGATEWTTKVTTADVQMMPPPVFGDVDGDGAGELVAVSNDGVVSIVNPENGEVRSSFERDEQIYVQPTLADVDENGVVEILVMYADGRVIALSAEE